MTDAPAEEEGGGGHEPVDSAIFRMILPGAEGGSRRELQWSVPSALLRRYLAFGIVCAVGATVLLGTWVFFAARSAGIGVMHQRIAELEQERQQVRELAATLEEAEESYQRLRDLFLPEGGQAGPLWLPPAGAGGAGGSRSEGGAAASDDDAAASPHLWPLTERGFLTRGLGAADDALAEGGTHPGIDIAVPSGSYFRAVGAGRVVERGEDPVYGLFVVVEHAGGYRSLYAHASVISAEPGQEVGAGEVLGLTGSSGRSSAPHLHVEITRSGDHVDPLTLLRRP